MGALGGVALAALAVGIYTTSGLVSGVFAFGIMSAIFIGFSVLNLFTARGERTTAFPVLLLTDTELVYLPTGLRMGMADVRKCFPQADPMDAFSARKGLVIEYLGDGGRVSQVLVPTSKLDRSAEQIMEAIARRVVEAREKTP